MWIIKNTLVSVKQNGLTAETILELANTPANFADDRFPQIFIYATYGNVVPVDIPYVLNGKLIEA